MNPTTHRGYWCECWTQSPATGEAPALLASFDADTAAQAVRWVRVALRTIASALEPDAQDRAWGWLASGHRTAAHALAHNEPCTFTIRHVSTRIEWTARPVLFLPLAYRQGAKLPACVEKFTQAQQSTEPGSADR